MNNKLVFEKATYDEKFKIFDLYQSMMDNEYSTWDEDYPSMHNIEEDIKFNFLYVLKNEGEIIGSISINPENELNDLNLWEEKNAKEFGRLVISKDFQGRKLGFLMVENIEKIIKNLGCKAIHIIVSKKNIPAYKTYIRANYINRGEVDMFGHEFYAMEKIL